MRIHPHALKRMLERGCKKAEVEYTVKHGKRSKANFDRTKFTHTFAYNRKWLGTHYDHKIVEAFAIDESGDEDDVEDWLVITVIVKYF